MVTNDLIDSVISAIDTEFNGIYPIYTETVKQGLVEPCFFVFPLEATVNVDLNKRYKRSNPFNIQYLDINYSSRYDVMERLADCLEVIECNGKKFRNEGFSAETVNGEILNCLVTYDTFEYRLPDIEIMMELEQNTVVK